MYGCMSGWMFEWMDGCLDGWMDVWMDGGRDEWIDGYQPMIQKMQEQRCSVFGGGRMDNALR